DGARVGQRHLSRGRGIQGGRGEAEGKAGRREGDHAAAVNAKTAKRAQHAKSVKSARHAKNRLLFASFAIFAAFAFAPLQVPFAQQPVPSAALPMGPGRNAGEAVTGAFEGWYYDK